jgi:hypothetical protein
MVQTLAIDSRPTFVCAQVIVTPVRPVITMDSNGTNEKATTIQDVMAKNL